MIIFKVKRAISGHSGGRSDTLTGAIFKVSFVFPKGFNLIGKCKMFVKKIVYDFTKILPAFCYYCNKKVTTRKPYLKKEGQCSKVRV